MRVPGLHLLDETDRLRDGLNRQAVEVLPIASRLYVLVFALLTIGHLLLLPLEFRLNMVVLSMSAVVVGAVIAVLHTSPIISESARAVLWAMILWAMVNSSAHLYLSGNLDHTTNFALIVVASAYLLPGYRDFTLVMLLVLLTWAGIANGIGGEDRFHALFVMLLGTIAGLLILVLRRKAISQTLLLEDSLRQVEEGQQNHQLLLQELLDKLPIAILMRTKTGVPVFANEEARTILRRVYGDELDLSQSIRLKVYDADGRPTDTDDAPFTRVSDTGEPVTGQLLALKDRDGSFIWGLSDVFRIHMDSIGEEVVVSSFINITDRRSLEVQLQQQDERARLILESVQDGVISVDSINRITLYNNGAAAITGFQENVALGSLLESVFRFQEDPDYQGDPSGIRQGILRTAYGTIIRVEVLVSELGHGGFVYTFRDVSEQVTFEQERAMHDKMMSVGILAGGIAHDFNNLLTAIYGNLTLAERHLHDPGKATAFLRQSSESIELATNLTTQLLTFARGSEPVKEAVDLERLVRECARLALSGSSIAVTYSVADGLAAADADSGQIQQAVSNVVINAKQAMEDSGVLNIEIRNKDNRVAEEAEFVEVSVTDQGPGIDPELVGKIFDPYFTTKETGSGLGLATAHSILVKHGGSINVTSEPGKGTTLTLCIPAAGPIPEVSVSSDESVNVGSERYNILVMDDEEVVRQTFHDLLDTYGHQVAEARSGEEAVELYREAKEQSCPFDIVLMDLTVVGGMGGKEATARILEMDPQARVVVASGYSADAEMANYEQFGFCGRLEKPFRAQRLQATIAEVMSH